MKKFALWSILLLFVVAVAACGKDDDGIQIEDDLVAGPVSLDEAAITAKLEGSKLTLFFPLENSGGATVDGSLTVETEHLSGDIVSDGSDSVTVKPGSNTLEIVLSGTPEIDSIGKEVEYVVRYEFDLDTGKIQGKRSLFMIIPKADLIVVVPNELVAGQMTNVRTFLIDPRTNTPLVGKEIELEATREDGTKATYKGESDERGVAVIEMPAEDAGALQLKAKVFDDDVEGEVEVQVEVVKDSKLLLTSDKPMYQPGQKIHLRALALNRFDKSPLAGEEIIFEVLDAKGNKVFKRADSTNDFGVAWAEFQLGIKVILGPYSIKATVGEVVSEKTVTVDRYTLPKFKVQANLNKGFYQPGATVHGEVQADYFFGKPVAGGDVKVVVYNYMAEWVPDAEINGKTNDEGLYVFDYQLPDYLIGQPIEDGKAMVMMEIFVTDTADHEQKVAKNLLVTSNLLDVVVIPESGEVIPDVTNLFYIFASDPTGAVAQGEATITVNGAELDDEDDVIIIPQKGPGKIELLPHNGILEIDVDMVDADGNAASRSFSFNVGDSEANILVRTDRALYKVGDTMDITAYITGGHDHIFLDIVRKNQTVLTKTLDADEGVANLVVDLDNEMTEDLVIDAYMLADSGQFIRDTRIVYVQPANELSIEITTDQDEYLPGESATVEFEITGQDGEPAHSALGLQVVDEAVYALSEIKPGLLKLYFQLEEELQNPTYQIGPANGFSLGGLIMSGGGAEPGSDEDVAIQETTAAAFAAMGDSPLNQQQVSSWNDNLAEAKGALTEFYNTRKDAITGKLENKLAGSKTDFDQACDYLKDYLAAPRFYDFWNNPYLFEVTGDNWDCKVTLTSRGPDEKLLSADDWSASMELWDLMGDNWRGGEKGAPMAAMGGGGDWDGEGDFAANDEQNAGPPEAHEEEPGDPSTTSDDGGGSDKAAVKIRKWFPETLFVEPSLITDKDGKAQVTIPLADSITEWRMTTMANSTVGQLGSRTDGIVVFQDFFVDIDFPKFLTQNDEVQFPIAVYNYLEETQTVNIELDQGEWFDPMGETSTVLSLSAGQVSVVYFPVRVHKVGLHKLTVWGMGDKFQDAVQRTVEVKPDGKEVVVTESARFDNDGETASQDQVAVNIDFPGGSIENSQSIVVKVLPGLSSHIVEGMESMLKLPGG